MPPEHAGAVRKRARDKLTYETYPGLEAVWSDQLESVSAILTNIEKALTKAYRRNGQTRPLALSTSVHIVCRAATINQELPDHVIKRVEELAKKQTRRRSRSTSTDATRTTTSLRAGDLYKRDAATRDNLVSNVAIAGNPARSGELEL